MATTTGSSYKRMFNTRLFKKKQSREWSGLICLLEMKTCIHTLAVRLHPWRGIDSVTEQAIAGQCGAHYSRHTWTYNTQKDPQYCKRVYCIINYPNESSLPVWFITRIYSDPELNSALFSIGECMLPHHSLNRQSKFSYLNHVFIVVAMWQTFDKKDMHDF